VVDEAFPVETIKPPKSSHLFQFPCRYNVETKITKKQIYKVVPERYENPAVMRPLIIVQIFLAMW
jgi:hypothetical protein